MIYTDDKCVACNRCVHVCPAIGANVTANEDGRISIDVSDKNCIHCGRCIKECIHEARQYKDSLPDMLLDLKRGTQISVIVDPTFVVAYGRENGYVEVEYYDDNLNRYYRVWVPSSAVSLD